MILYMLKRMLRTPMPCIAAILITFAFTILLGQLTETINTQNTQLDYIYSNMRINCVFANPKGKTDGITITNTLINVCLTEDYKVSEYISDPLFKRSLTYRIENKDALLVGVNSNRLFDELKDLPDFKFKSSEYVIFVNENSSNEIGDVLNITVRFNDSYEAVRFKVEGVYPGTDSDTIYCPWNVICDLAIKLGSQVSAESGSFTLADNRKLLEFKEVADEYFDQVDVTGSGISSHLSGIALIIYDSEFNSIISATLRNIKMLEVLLPLFLLLSAGIGFLESFLLIRNRYREFNIMRRIGIKPLVIIEVTLLEQSLLAIIGVGLGVFMYLTSVAFLLLLCYISGAFISTAFVFRNSVIKTNHE